MLVVQLGVAHVLGNEYERRQRVRHGGVLVLCVSLGPRGCLLGNGRQGVGCCLHVDQGQVFAMCDIVAMDNEHRRLPRVPGAGRPLMDFAKQGEGV